MRAVQIDSYGGLGAREVRDVAQPEARRGEVVIRLGALPIHSVDFKSRSGAQNRTSLGRQTWPSPPALS